MAETMIQSLGEIQVWGGSTRRADWRARSACRGHDVSVFFPSEGTTIGFEARQICASCPVSVECLNCALADSSLQGIWAGTSERGRARMRAAQRRERASAG